MFDEYLFQTSSVLLQQISDAFGDSRDTLSPASLVLSVVILIGIMLCGYLLFRRLVRARDEQLINTLSKKEIMAILDQALHHRSRMDVSFHPITTSRQTISCSLLELQTEGILLELPMGINPSESWAGRMMTCFFRIPRQDGNPYFYKFTTPVNEIKEISGVQYIVLAIPEKIELGQKRKHLRIAISSMDVVDFRIWPATEDSSFHYETDPAKWPEPLAVFSREAGKHLRIVDISGGGIRMMFDPEEYESLDAFVAEHPVLFMRLELASSSTRGQLLYFVAARLRTKMKDFDSGAMMLGYEFVECSEPNGETFDWIKIRPEEGIDELVTWIFRRHLELYRERNNF